MCSPSDLFTPADSPMLGETQPDSAATCSEPSIRVLLDPLVEATINRLNRKRFQPDPIAGEHFSRIVSIMSSAYKRHGHILERAILEQLKTCPDLQVWNDPVFQIPANADLVASGHLGEPGTILGNEVNYGPGNR